MVLALTGAGPMMVGNISELRVAGVFDRGVANQERIVILANQIVNMGQFGLILGIRQQGAFAYPIRDNFYWFGDGYVNVGDWIFVYTGPGESRTSELPGGSSGKLYSLHWGRNETILGLPEVVPILFRVDAVEIFTETLTLPSASEQKV